MAKKKNKILSVVLVALSCLLILGGCYYYFRVNGSGVLVERKLGYKDFLDLEVVIGADITFSEPLNPTGFAGGDVLTAVPLEEV